MPPGTRCIARLIEVDLPEIKLEEGFLRTP
jgi:hypothetical protein